MGKHKNSEQSSSLSQTDHDSSVANVNRTSKRIKANTNKDKIVQEKRSEVVSRQSVTKRLKANQRLIDDVQAGLSVASDESARGKSRSTQVTTQSESNNKIDATYVDENQIVIFSVDRGDETFAQCQQSDENSSDSEAEGEEEQMEKANSEEGEIVPSSDDEEQESACEIEHSVSAIDRINQ